MKREIRLWMFSFAMLVGGLLATASPLLASKPASTMKHGVLRVYNEANLFTTTGIDAAKKKMEASLFDSGLTITVDTYPRIPEERQAAYNKENEAAFYREWATSRATDDKAKGIYILINRSPGYVAVLTDATTRERGFTKEDEQQLRDILLTAFHAAAKLNDEPEKEMQIRDDALLAAVNFVIEDLKDTQVAAKAGQTQPRNQGQGSGIFGWICIGLCVLLGVWLVIGLIRMFTGGGGGGGAGGGGGGFGSSLLGGLFGAMAGMWLYNNLFGGHSMGSDAYAGDGGAGGTDGSGDGDFGGDTGSGGNFDDGGGDWGGGGDFGGDF